MENTSFSKPIFKLLALMSVLVLIVQGALFLLLNRPDPHLAEQQLDRLTIESKLISRALTSPLQQKDISATEQILFQTRNGDASRAIYLYGEAERGDAELLAHTNNVQGFVPQPRWQDLAMQQNGYLVVHQVIELPQQRRALLIYVQQLQQKTLWPYAVIFAISLTIGLLFSGFFAYAISGFFSRRIKPLLQGTRQALDKAQFDSSVDSHAKDSYGVLGSYINQLFRKIAQTQEALQESEQNIKTLKQEVDTRIKERTDALEAAKLTAEKANEAKSTFLATMSHEIRTPMNGIIGTIDLLRKTQLSTSQFRMTDTVRESSFSLLRILDDILDFSKIEAGKLELETIPLSLVDIIEAVGRILVSVAHQRQIDLKLFIDPRIPDGLVGDPVRLRQILYNLAGNAIKFTQTTPEKTGLVIIKADLLEENMDFSQIKFSIVDNGKGMTQRQISYVFQPFNQAEGSITRKFGGTGLGLSICQRLTTLMYGEINVKSQVDKGTEFDVCIPMRRSDEIQYINKELLRDIHLCLFSADPHNQAHLSAYFTYADADLEVEISFDGLLRRAQAMKPLPPKQAAVWVLDATYEQISANEIDQLQHLASMSQVQFVVITNQVELSERSSERVYYLHSSPICRSHLYDAVLIAAKRKPKPVYVGEKAPIAKAPSIEQARKQHRLVLLAEDNLMNQRVIVDQLNALGYAVEVADDGAVALDKWRQFHYPLILTDLHMPNMSGYDLATAIRKESLHLSEGAEFTRIIAVTANALKGEEQKCLSIGMDGYITKPIELATLETMLSRWLPHLPAGKNSTGANSDITSQKTSPICFTTIANFLGNDSAKHEEHLNYFVKHAADLLSNLAAHVDKQDRSGVRSVAHQLKAVTKSIGALSLSAQALKLEKAAEESDWSVINECIRLIQEQYQDVVSYVTQRY